jgi:hypothetical protein
VIAVAAMPEFPQWLWDDVLDALYDRAAWAWENDHSELADAIAELADALAKEPPVASLRGEL